MPTNTPVSPPVARSSQPSAPSGPASACPRLCLMKAMSTITISTSGSEYSASTTRMIALSTDLPA